MCDNFVSPASLFNMASSVGFPQHFQALDIIRGGAYVPSGPMLFAFIISLWVLHRFNVQRKNKLPPGPLAWPIIGNLNQLGKLPHRDLNELGKKYGPIMTLKLGSFPTVVVSSSAMAKEFVKTHDLDFSSRPAMAVGKYLAYNFKDVAIAPYGLYWRHMRKLCVVGLLNAKRIESFRSVREEEARLFVRSVWEMSEEGKKPVNLTNMLLAYTLTTMWRILSGKNQSFYSNGGGEILKMFSEVSAVAAEVNIGDFVPSLHWIDSISGVKQRMKKVHSSFDRVVRNIIEEHQQRRRKLQEENENEHEHATKVFVDELLEMETLDGNAITEENIKAIVLDMLIAGVETTATTLGWLMSLVIKNPNVAKKMQEEMESVVGRERTVREDDVGRMEYLQCVVKETLRLFPAAPLMLPHESTQDCKVGEYVIPVKSRLIINAWAIARDGSVWEAPLEFRPERFIGRDVDIARDKDWYDMLPFGAGRRGCPGANMAIVTINFLSAQLFHCFDWTVEGDLDMTEGASSMRRSVDLVALPHFRLNTIL